LAPLLAGLWFALAATAGLSEAARADAAAADPPPKPRVYLVALADGGQHGEPVGCGDSLVADGRAVPTDLEGLRASIERLLALPREPAGEYGPYNALGGSRLVLEQVRADRHGLVVRLSGRLWLGGMCDGPRVRAQLERTAGQLPAARPVQIELNGKPLAAALSLQ